VQALVWVDNTVSVSRQQPFTYAYKGK